MVAKINLEKVYDQMKWPFLTEVLHQMGFNDHMVKLIIKCNGKTIFSILWNGEKLEGFTLSRGIQ